MEEKNCKSQGRPFPPCLEHTVFLPRADAQREELLNLLRGLLGFIVT
jgi:hypothetical protein